MAETVVSIAGVPVRVACPEDGAGRIRDLAAVLERRLGPAAEEDLPGALARAALQLLAEGQRAGAALARANVEIDQLNELLLAKDGGGRRLERATERP